MRSDDEADFTEFVAGSSRRLLGVARLVTGGDPRAAEELLTGALEHAYRSWPRHKREGAPEAYVRRLLRNAGPGQLVDSLEVTDAVVSPPPDLAARARQRVRQRRRRVRAGLAIVAVAIGAVAVAVTGDNHHGPRRTLVAPQPSFRVSVGGVAAMAVGAGTLYAARSEYPDAFLTSYDATTGAMVSDAALPGRPSSVTVAADLTVWVTFYPSNVEQRSGVEEFSPDLQRSSTLLTDDGYLDTAALDVMPLGRDRALLATGRGLVRVRLPRPVRHLTLHASQHNAVVESLATTDLGTPTQLVALPDGAVAALLTSDDGHSQVRLRGGHGRFGGRQLTVAASPEGLWVTAATGRQRLRLLNTSLRPRPAGQVVHSASLRRGADRVWTNGMTVWVATSSQEISLRCFVYRASAGPPAATVSLPAGDAAELTDPSRTGDLVVLPTDQQVYVAGPFGIRSYPVPAVCRA